MNLNCYFNVLVQQWDNGTLQLAANELANLTLRRFSKAGSVSAKFSLEENLPSFEVRVNGNTIIIAGPNPVEILYGVYDFAEKFLGYCFFEPGRDILNGSGSVELPEGIIIPAKPVPFSTRGFIQEFPFNCDSISLADWMAKNKLNTLNFWMKYYDDIDEKTKQAFLIRGIEMQSGHHNFDYFIPADKYYETHPEFFAEYDGKRTKSEKDANALLLGKQLCTTNKELRKEIVKNMVAYAEKHPELHTLSLIPNDGFGWCECAECSKFYDKSKKGELYSLSAHVYLANEIYHDMVQDVAAQLAEKHPELELIFCDYINYCRPANGFKLKKGLVTNFAPYWRCINHTIDDENCPVNSRYADDIRAWCKVKDGGKVTIYEYYMGVNFYLSLPMIHHRNIFKEIKFYQNLGVDGVTTQFHIPHWSVYGLNYKAMAHALRGDEENTVVPWLMRSLFGKDAAEAETFYESIHALLLSAGACHIPYPYSLFNRTKLEQYGELLKLSKKLADKEQHSQFRQDLTVWMEYIYRFKSTFDAYHAGAAGIAEVDRLAAWIHSHRDSRVFVQSKFDMYFEAWRLAIREHKRWIHFNLDWEDNYILQHDEMWKLSKEKK